MKWEVFRYDINQRKIVHWDIFEHYSFINDCMVIYNELCSMKIDFLEFQKRVESKARWYFWCKSEHEILIRGWCGAKGDEEIKVDIFEQLKLNWEAFIANLICYLEDLKGRENE